MKKFFLITLLLLFFNKQFAQIQKGTLVPGFALNGLYSATTTSDSVVNNKNYSWQAGLNLRYGKFIKDNLLLSGSLGYSYYDRNYKNGYPLLAHSDYSMDNYTNSITCGVGVSKYKFITESFAVSFGPSLTLSYSDGFNTTGQYKSYLDANNNQYWVFNKTSTYQNSITTQLYLSAGIQYFLSKNLALAGSLGFFSASYSTSPYATHKHVEQNSINFYLTPSFNAFNVGLAYYFRPKTDAQ